MPLELEATFADINKDDVRSHLQKVGAKLIKSEFIQRRFTFHPPQGCQVEHSWMRVRDEGDKITMSIKSFTGESIEQQKEIMLVVDSFENAKAFLEFTGCRLKSYQETKRELWHYKNCEITIDEWPFLEPFVEIEGPNESIVKEVSEELGFDYSEAIFGPVHLLYGKKYGVSPLRVNGETPLIKFDMENPFL